MAYRAGRLRVDSDDLYSFSGDLHSVRKSLARGNRLRNACWAAWIASAGLIPFHRISSNTEVERSSQNPLASRSYGAVSRSMESRIAFCLQSDSGLDRSGGVHVYQCKPDFEESWVRISYIGMVVGGLVTHRKRKTLSQCDHRTPAEWSAWIVGCDKFAQHQYSCGSFRRQFTFHK